MINIDYRGSRAFSQILHNSHRIVRTLVKLDWGTLSRPHFNLITSLKTLFPNVYFDRLGLQHMNWTGEEYNGVYNTTLLTSFLPSLSLTHSLFPP